MDGGAWRATVHSVAESCTWLKWLSANWDVTNSGNWWFWNPISTLRMSSPISLVNPCAPRISRCLQGSHIYSQVALSLTSSLSTVSLKKRPLPRKVLSGSYYCCPDDPHHDSISVYAKGMFLWVPKTPVLAHRDGARFWAETEKSLSNFADPLLPGPEAALLTPWVSKDPHRSRPFFFGLWHLFSTNSPPAYGPCRRTVTIQSLLPAWFFSLEPSHQQETKALPSSFSPNKSSCVHSFRQRSAFSGCVGTERSPESRYPVTAVRPSDH